MAKLERVNIRITDEEKLEGIALGLMSAQTLSGLIRTLIIRESQKEAKERPELLKDFRAKAVKVINEEKRKAAQRNGQKRRVAISHDKANENERSSRIPDTQRRRAVGGGRKR